MQLTSHAPFKPTHVSLASSKMSSQLRLLADTVSPPCRAVMLLLAVNKIPYEYVKISLKDSENLTHPELGSINPSKRIPAIEDNGYTLFESTAILKYICNKYGLADHWYPKDIKRQGKVDEALNWFPQNLRCGAYYLTAVLPHKSGKCTPEALLEHSQTTVKKSIQVVEDYYLMNTKFVAGDEISIADLLYIAEVTQYLKMGVNLAEGRPKVTQWLSDVKEALQPYYDEIYKEEYRTVEAKTFFTEMKY